MKHGTKYIGIVALVVTGCASPIDTGLSAAQKAVDTYASKVGQEQTIMSFRESLLDAEAKKTGRVVLNRGAKVSPYYYEDFSKQKLTNGVVRKRVAIEEEVLVDADVVAPQVSADVVLPIPEVKIETSPNQGVFGEIIRGGK